MTFFLGQSFAVRVMYRQNMLTKIMLLNEIQAFFVSLFFRADVFQVKLNNISFLFKFNLTLH